MDMDAKECDMNTYELWYSEPDQFSSAKQFYFFVANTEDACKDLPQNAKLLWTVTASSWEEAQAKKHEYLGWEPYKPMD